MSNDFVPGWERWFLLAIVVLEGAAGVAYLIRGNVKLGCVWIFYALAAAFLVPWSSDRPPS